MVVEIPRLAEHHGYDGNLVKVEIADTCPKCGKKRAIEFGRGFSFDGSRRLAVDIWENECGHIDKYSEVRAEGNIVPYSTPSITAIFNPVAHENMK